MPSRPTGSPLPVSLPRRSAGCLALLLLGAVPLAAQDGGRPPVDREAMWPAPTAEDWAKPCLIRWQRSWEDALEVAKRTGKPILVCVNMDGEIASEHYAGIRYRQPEIAALYEPYVCVIASVYRHNPVDYDEQGRRIECPRFGTVTCGEHIALEPVVYERFLDGQRVAPRHIGVGQGGEELYDVYYAWDTDSVFEAIREGVAGWPPPLRPGSDRTLEDQVASPDSRDREEVERLFLEGSPGDRRRILEAAAALGADAPLQILRLAIRGADAGLARAARRALGSVPRPEAVQVLLEELGRPMEREDREVVLESLERLGERLPEARSLARVHRGLAEAEATVDLGPWFQAPAVVPAFPERSTLEARLEYAGATAADPEALTERAEAALLLAVDPESRRDLTGLRGLAGRHQRLRFEDALRAAAEAREAGARDGRVDAVEAAAAWYLGRDEEAFARAEAAVRALPPGASSWTAFAALSIFAEGRRRAILAAREKGEEWPVEWLRDVHGVYALLGDHPLGSPELVAAHVDFLDELGGRAAAEPVLQQGLRRFPDSWALQERFRRFVLREQSVEALEPAYAAWMAEPGAPENLAWWAGYASLFTAEHHRRQGRPGLARKAYGRALQRYEEAIARNPATREASDHWIALALAGRARLALEQGRLAEAVDDLIASFERKPEAAASHDGLNLSPAMTARTLEFRLQRAGETELLARLRSAMDRLDPALLELPAFERAGPPPGRSPGAGGGG